MSESTKASLGSLDDDRGLFEGVKESLDDALDLFAGVNQADVAAGRVDLDSLSREDRIALLVDGETSSVFGSSPWSIGVTLNESVTQEIHAEKGGSLVFGIEAGFLDAAQGAVRAVRYALIWDDSTIAETGNVSISAIGKTFLIVGLKDEPRGRSLTLWITDNDLRVALLRQGRLQDLERQRAEIIGEVGAAADKDPNPITETVNKVVGFVGATQIGGLVVLVVLAVGLVLIVRSEAGKDIARTAKEVLT